MDIDDAIRALAALSQPTRLDAFRRLVRAGETGMPAGRLAESLGVPQNTLSAHLAILSGAGLVRGERRGRSILYHAELERFRAVVIYLLADCCGGHPEVCTPVVQSLSALQPSTAGCR